MNYPNIDNAIRVNRLIALWGFSEAALGGILHALKIPFTGLFIGGAAVFFISLIAKYSDSKSNILRATLIVILVKAVVSPFIPLTSYLAVSIQGFLGYILFKYLPFGRIASIILGALALSLSAFQKVIILTLIFGNGIWTAFDSFIKFLFIQFSLPKQFYSLKASLILITVYSFMHLAAGIFVGLKTIKFEKWLKEKSKHIHKHPLNNNLSLQHNQSSNRRKKKRWWQRSSGILILSLSLIIMVLSFIYPELGKNTAYDIIFMLVRSFIITFIWFNFISPFIMKWFKKFIDSKKFEHATEVNQITELFPNFKKLIYFSWDFTSDYKGIKRIKAFISEAVALLFLIEFENE